MSVMQQVPPLQLAWPSEAVAELCRRWKIQELSVFGSALREDFGSESDVDHLVRFAPEAEWSLLDHVRLERELERVLGRKVDVVTLEAIEESPNWLVRREILRSAKTAYAR